MDGDDGVDGVNIDPELAKWSVPSNAKDGEDTSDGLDDFPTSEGEIDSDDDLIIFVKETVKKNGSLKPKVEVKKEENPEPVGMKKPVTVKTGVREPRSRK